MNKEKLEKINVLLLHNWDPLGIKNTPGAENEYLHYVTEIELIIMNSHSNTPLFEYLWEIETQHMGLKGNRAETENFSRILFREIKNISTN